MSRLVVRPGGPLRGCWSVPGDKSISHRALLLSALADGPSQIDGFLPAGDCLATLRCVEALGIDVHRHGSTSLTVHGQGLGGLRPPAGPLRCARSATTMRLLAGILAGQTFDSVLTGDPQLLRRPMRRIVDPLRRMGGWIEAHSGHAPLSIRGQRLRGCEHDLLVASAQVKSALLLAGLYAEGCTTVKQPGPARDHTERLLAAMGAEIRTSGLAVALCPGRVLLPLSLRIPGDLSAAAFPLVAAVLLQGSDLTLQDVGVNPTRTGLLDVLIAMGADVKVEGRRELGNEPVANLTVRASQLDGVQVNGGTVVRMIDELPILAVAATQARGSTVVRDAAELRAKETDRIEAIVVELRRLGATIDPLADGFAVQGPTALRGAVVDSHGDHRVALALAIAGLVAAEEVVLENAQCIDDSFPGFVHWMRQLGVRYD